MDYEMKQAETAKPYKRISLTQCQFAIVDSEDFNELDKLKWFAHDVVGNKTFYASSSMNCKGIVMHRQIMNTPKGMSVDHINHNTLDNRKENLRNCTRSQNMMNSRIYSNNKSGTTGVSFFKSQNKWISKITFNKKRIYLGLFVKIEDAIKARKDAEIKYFGEFAYNSKRGNQ